MSNKILTIAISTLVLLSVTTIINGQQDSLKFDFKPPKFDFPSLGQGILRTNEFQAPPKFDVQTPPKFNFQAPKPPNNNFLMSGNGGGSLKTGVDLNLGGQAKLWESQNGRNSLHGTGAYSQHLGGPFGNSKPNFGGGLSFIRRF